MAAEKKYHLGIARISFGALHALLHLPEECVIKDVRPCAHEFDGFGKPSVRRFEILLEGPMLPPSGEMTRTPYVTIVTHQIDSELLPLDAVPDEAPACDAAGW